MSSQGKQQQQQQQQRRLRRRLWLLSMIYFKDGPMRSASAPSYASRRMHSPSVLSRRCRRRVARVATVAAARRTAAWRAVEASALWKPMQRLARGCCEVWALTWMLSCWTRSMRCFRSRWSRRAWATTDSGIGRRRGGSSGVLRVWELRVADPRRSCSHASSLLPCGCATHRLVHRPWGGARVRRRGTRRHAPGALGTTPRGLRCN